jgi:tRNA A-37 threonylcarbamoyl transferase component Bud32
MKDSQSVHPDAARLRAFGLGEIEPAEAAAIESHVARCTVCCQTLWSLSDDQLVSRLRQAFRNPPEAVDPQADTLAPGADDGPPVPAELAEHPRYRILGVLGVGGMGIVYKAEHRLMERPVALKMIDRNLTNKPAVVERFRREVRAAAQLNHPNIVHAYDADQAGEGHFLVMEFVEGTTLARRVEQGGPLAVAEACDYIRQAGLGLQRAHEHGMVHRDIKPQNLMRTPQGQIKILDFGLARLVRGAAPAIDSSVPETSRGSGGPEGLTQMGMVMGTADYMAPEQATDPHTADIRADIYSLGCTLYYLLAGQPPFPEGTISDKLLAHDKRSPLPLVAFRKDVPAALVRVLERMTAKEPARRYQTPAEVAEVLRPFAAQRPARWRGRVFAAVMLASVLTALVGGIVAVWALISVQTDRGEFVIETSDPDIAVQLAKTGMKLQDRATNRAYLLQVGKSKLPSGEYEIDVSELPDGVEMSVTTFTLRRGGRVVATARLRAAPGDRKAQAESGLLKSYGPDEKTLTRDGVTVDQGGWRLEAKEKRTFRLFEFTVKPPLDNCMVVYRARLKAENVKGEAYLEMLCHFPALGDAFSRGLLNPVTGTTDWASYETPFYLKKGEQPDVIRLNVVLQGAGTLWIKDITVQRLPLPPQFNMNIGGDR